MNFWNSTYSTSFLTNRVCRHWDSLFQLCAGVGGRSFLTIARERTFFLCYYHYSRCETRLDSSLRWKINSTCFGENNHGTWQLVEASAFREAERWQTRWSSEEVTIGQSVRSHAFTKHLCVCSALSGGVGGKRKCRNHGLWTPGIYCLFEKAGEISAVNLGAPEGYTSNAWCFGADCKYRSNAVWTSEIS